MLRLQIPVDSFEVFLPERQRVMSSERIDMSSVGIEPIAWHFLRT